MCHLCRSVCGRLLTVVGVAFLAATLEAAPATSVQQAYLKASNAGSSDYFGYRLERATNLNGPWTTLTTLVAPASEMLEFHDTKAPASQAFYRTAQP